MKASLARAAAFVALPILLVAQAVAAQTPKPSPTPAPTPVAFSAHAHANVTVTAQNGPMSGTAQLGLAQRGSLIRVDVLSVKSDTLPIPPITATLVIDRTANTVTAWSDTTKLYHVQPFLPRSSPSPTPRPGATPPPARRGASPLANLDVFEMSLKLTGHTTTAGIPTTGMAFDLQVRNKGATASSHVTASTQLADNFAMFPMSIDVSIEPGATPFNAKLAYAVDDFTAGPPPFATFDVPSGYTEAGSLLGVIFPNRRPATPAPAK
jgi:hypothetical protein